MAKFRRQWGIPHVARQIVVLSAIEAEDYECEDRWACVSIATSEDAFIRVGRKRRRGLLQIAFADSFKPLPGLILFDTDHAHDILDLSPSTGSGSTR